MQYIPQLILKFTERSPKTIFSFNSSNICFSSCFSLVKVELSVPGATKFEMCVVICFLHAECQSAVGILSNWTLNIQNEMPPPLWVWIGLNYIFSLWGTSEVNFKRKKTEKWFSRAASWPSACEKCITTHISNLAAPATGNSTFTRLKTEARWETYIWSSKFYSVVVQTSWTFSPC